MTEFFKVLFTVLYLLNYSVLIEIKRKNKYFVTSKYLVGQNIDITIILKIYEIMKIFQLRTSETFGKKTCLYHSLWKTSHAFNIKSKANFISHSTEWLDTNSTILHFEMIVCVKLYIGFSTCRSVLVIQFESNSRPSRTFSIYYIHPGLKQDRLAYKVVINSQHSF